MMRAISTISAGATALALLTATGCGAGDAQTRLRSAVDAKSPELNQCYAAALERDAQTSGRLQAWLYVEDAEGRLERVEFTGGDVRDQALQSCMSDTLTQVQIDEAPPVNLKVDYTFQLQAQPPPPAPPPQQQPQQPQS